MAYVSSRSVNLGGILMNTINEILVEILKLKKENKILRNENKALRNENKALRNELNVHMNNELDLMLKLKGFKDYIKTLENKILS